MACMPNAGWVTRFPAWRYASKTCTSRHQCSQRQARPGLRAHPSPPRLCRFPCCTNFLTVKASNGCIFCEQIICNNSAGSAYRSQCSEHHQRVPWHPRVRLSSSPAPSTHMCRGLLNCNAVRRMQQHRADVLSVRRGVAQIYVLKDGNPAPPQDQACHPQPRHVCAAAGALHPASGPSRLRWPPHRKIGGTLRGLHGFVA